MTECPREVLRAALRRWKDLDSASIQAALFALLDQLGGCAWIERNPRFLFDPDDVFHARSLALASGWQPPVVYTFEYRGYVLFLDDDRVRYILRSL